MVNDIQESDLNGIAAKAIMGTTNGSVKEDWI